MQKANEILSILNHKSKNDENYKFDRIYRNLYNKDFYLNAYAKIYSKEGNMTEGVDGQTIDGFNLVLVEKLIEDLKAEQYYPKPVRRTYIPKKNGKKRPLGIPSFVDKLLQEVIREILEAIYEPNFSENSHGFRPNKSCHTALMQIKKTGKGTNWILEGDITGCFDNINHDILINILSRKIKDGRFIELIRRFLKAGYIEFKEVINSLSGCPQGSLISPILSNIYLNEFDKYMEQLIKDTNKGKGKRVNLEYKRLEHKRVKAIKNNEFDKAKEIFKKMRKIPSQRPNDETFIRVKYVRYADDFVVLVSGSKNLTLEIKERIREYLGTNLKLELNVEKTLITNISKDKARFLGFEITKAVDNNKITKTIAGVKRRAVNETIQLLVPSDVINKKIRMFSENEKPCSYKPRLRQPIYNTITEYNSEIRGLYNYYCIATNVSKRLYKFKYYHQKSLVCTIAQKEKISSKKVYKKYGIPIPKKTGTGTRNEIGVTYHTKKCEKTLIYFNDSIKKNDSIDINVRDVFGYNYSINSTLLLRLNKNECELCGSNEQIEVHHIRKLKDIKDKYRKRGQRVPNWVLTMSEMNRKTLIVCKKCHVKIHNGTINN